MTKATAKITDQFKSTYVYTYGMSDSAVEAVQEAYFRMGFSYYGKRTAWKGPHSYIRVDEDGRMFRASGTHKNRPAAYGEHKSVEVFYAFLSDSAEAVRRIKREESKASKKRRAQRKWDATATKRTTEVCPVRRDVIVSVRLNNGATYTGEAGKWDWATSDSMRFADIESYKVLSKNKHRPLPEKGTTLSLEQMATGIAESLNREVAIPVSSAEILDASNNVIGVTSVTEVAPVGDVNSDSRGSGARYNAGKPDFSLIPMALLEGEARVWNYGAKKYKAWNWMKGMDWSVPFACAMRHMAAWQRGEDTDPETGESHLDHAMCNLRMLRYYADFYKEGDNRPKEFFAPEQK
jgi:ribosomal protein L32